MIACLSIPGFELKAALRRSPSLALRPSALAPEPGGEPLLGPVTAAAEAAGVLPGMRLGEALATCPRLVLVDRDPAAAEQAWEEIVRSLEDAGYAVEPAALGVAYFETRGVERLYGGLEPALRRALAAAGTAWDARIGIGPDEGPLDLWVIDLRVATPALTAKQVTKSPGLDDHDPAWSPDGRKITYVAESSSHGSASWQLYVSNANGSNRHIVTHACGACAIINDDPSWQPLRG